MHKAQFERYLADKAELLERITVLPRALQVGPNKELIISIIGPRRAGKTYLFYGIAKALSSEGCLYVNFEDLELDGATPKDILRYPLLYEETQGRPPAVLLLDEIQCVEGWERAVGQLFEQKRYGILVTGSSSKLLSKEIATQLRGRCITHLLLPLSFREFLYFKGWKPEGSLSSSGEAKARRYLEEFLGSGGLPDVVKDPNIRTKFLENYLDLVVYRDIVERHGIRNIPVLNAMIRSMISSCSNPYSVHKFYRTLKSQGLGVSKKTLYSYFQFLQDSLFIFPVWKYTASIRKSSLTIPKVYLADTGVASLRSGEDKGSWLENAVLLELLRRRNLDPSMGIYYWSDGRREADFVVTKGQRPESIIQVTYQLSEGNMDREVGGLLAASKELRCNDLTIMAWEEERHERIDGRTIKVIPTFKWLLGEPSRKPPVDRTNGLEPRSPGR